jgi:hypothetical protein
MARTARRVVSTPGSARAGFLAAACLIALGVAGCNSEKDRLRETTIPTYDQKTGKLTQVTFDMNKNGTIDTWTDMDGARALQTRLDRDEDGKIDRWEYFGADGKLEKVGFSRAGTGSPDAWAYERADGRTERIEISSTGDDKKIDRWEHYGAAGLARAEEDSNGDGRPDKWETYENGVVKTAAFDDDKDGTPDRRFTYAGGRLTLVETEPDGNGGFRRRVVPAR